MFGYVIQIAAHGVALCSKFAYLVYDVVSFSIRFVKDMFKDIIEHIICESILTLPVAIFSMLGKHFSRYKEMYEASSTNRTKSWISNPNWWQKIVFVKYINNTVFHPAEPEDLFKDNEFVGDADKPCSTFNTGAFFNAMNQTF